MHELNVTAFPMASSDIGTNNEVIYTLATESLTLLCRMFYDNDDISDTFGHWICTLNVVDEEVDYPERSFVVYPNTAHFVDDELYTVVIRSDLKSIGHDDLQNAYILIGTPADE